MTTPRVTVSSPVGQPSTDVVGRSQAEVKSFFQIHDWPTEIVEFDLGGGRIIDIIPLPGHLDDHIALYDRNTSLLFTGDSLYAGRPYFFPSKFKTYRASIQRLTSFVEEREVRHILGSHIEMSSEPGIDFPLGSVEHPNEHRLELGPQHLTELNNVLVGMGEQPRREVRDDFIVHPLPEFGPRAPTLASRMADAQQSVILKFVDGLFEEQPMSMDEIKDELKDPFATLVLSDTLLPSTIHEVLMALDAHNADPDGLPVQEVYLVSESGQIRVDAHDQEPIRRERAVITRTRGQDDIVMIAPSTRDRFLEVIAWDESKGAFNYYARKNVRTWVWRGDSQHALNPSSSGKGCFECHINGAPVMKELRDPWTNWHSQAQAIVDEAIPADSPLKNDPLFFPANLTGAQQLEKHVQAWAIATNKGRIDRLVQGRIDLRATLRPLFETTTANLAFSTKPSVSSSPSVPIPISFFLNARAFEDAVRVDVIIPEEFGNCEEFGCTLAVDRSIYQDSLVRYNFALRDRSGFEWKPADTFFAFAVPVPSDEDIDMIKQLVREDIVSRQFAACVIAVDFPNPVYSPLRAQLLSYVPEAPFPDIGETGVSETVARTISRRASELPDGHVERGALDQFLACWNLPDESWKATLSDRIQAYLKNVANRLNTTAGFFRLREARRGAPLAV